MKREELGDLMAVLAVSEDGSFTRAPGQLAKLAQTHGQAAGGAARPAPAHPDHAQRLAHAGRRAACPDPAARVRAGDWLRQRVTFDGAERFFAVDYHGNEAAIGTHRRGERPLSPGPFRGEYPLQEGARVVLARPGYARGAEPAAAEPRLQRQEAVGALHELREEEEPHHHREVEKARWRPLPCPATIRCDLRPCRLCPIPRLGLIQAQQTRNA